MRRLVAAVVLAVAAAVVVAAATRARPGGDVSVTVTRSPISRVR